jgi:hypothetical protein
MPLVLVLLLAGSPAPTLAAAPHDPAAVGLFRSAGG